MGDTVGISGTNAPAREFARSLLELPPASSQSGIPLQTANFLRFPVLSRDNRRAGCPVEPVAAALVVEHVFFPFAAPLAFRRLHKVTHAFVSAAAQ